MKLTLLPFLATVISVAESSTLRSLDKFTDDADNRMLGELDDLTAVLASDEETEGRRLCDKKCRRKKRRKRRNRGDDDDDDDDDVGGGGKRLRMYCGRCLNSLLFVFVLS
jgi:hypothetical protein